MPDLEKVIKALVHHRESQCVIQDEVCPYWGDESCQLSLCEDAAYCLLKKQEPAYVYECENSKCVCGERISRNLYPNYCGFCGRELQWR